eukprot:CAMPEP_0119048680 /NCGR_PEP_ID=MMETSP1177-20130426/60371_1 /TAXON_ID=2985 /ORGANISM="Ochromonas sp, Strain CCMP1899" /LENGTH=166 /DNA_ID=CAMNT_0007024905 /DNA_START=1086 /DNA_END=1583 /DNA_ORIENTATION=-
MGILVYLRDPSSPPDININHQELDLELQKVRNEKTPKPSLWGAFKDLCRAVVGGYENTFSLESHTTEDSMQGDIENHAQRVEGRDKDQSSHSGGEGLSEEGNSNSTSQGQRKSLHESEEGGNKEYDDKERRSSKNEQGTESLDSSKPSSSKDEKDQDGGAEAKIKW